MKSVLALWFGRGRVASRLGVLCILLTSACTSVPRDPIVVMLDRELSPSRRVRALEQSRQGQLRDPQRIRALHDVAWDDTQPSELRHAAMNELLALDEQAFFTEAARRLPQLERWDAIQHICTLAAAKRRAPMVPALVHSWARESKEYADAHRPERIAIERITPDTPIDQIVWGVLYARDAAVTLPQRVAAWQVLHRIADRAALVDRLMRTDAGASSLVADLQAGWRDLGVLPRNREQVLWLMNLRGSGTWRRGSSYLKTASFDRCALRNVPAMSLAAAIPPRAELMLGGGMYPRRGDDTATMRPVDEHLQTHRDRLSPADLLTISTIVMHLSSIDVRASLFAQADLDLADTTTEHGGLLAINFATVQPQAYAPVITGNDRAFYPPPDMILEMYTALAHYHFHASAYDSAAYAGPGGGDLAFADRFGAACVVFTFIDRDTLNVDYYQEGGVVIDLGVIKRPQ